MKIIEYILVFTLGFIFGAITIAQLTTETPKEKEEAFVIWKTNHYLLNDSNLYNEIKAQGLIHPNIILHQAKLETGNFKSISCTKYNNLFGLRNKNGTYMEFNHWTESVDAYKKYIQVHYKGQDYYNFLDSLHYAEANNYTKVLKQLNNDKRRYSK